MNRETLNLILAGILLLVIIVGLNYFFFVKKKKQEIVRLNTQISKLDAEIKKARLFKKKYFEMEKEIALVEAELEKLKEKLPRKEDLPNLIRTIAKLAYYSGINFLSLKMGKEKIYPEKNYAVINMNVDFIATYGQLMVFLHSVDGLDRLLKPYKLKIGVTGKKAVENPVLNIKGVLQTYRFVESPPKGHRKGGRRRAKKR